MTAEPEVLPGGVGEVVSVTVPHWGNAGFVWNPRFEASDLQFVGRELVGLDRDHPREVRLSFRIMSPGARLRLELARPGASVRETRAYVIGR